MHLFNSHPVLLDNCIDGLRKDRGGVSCGKPAADPIHLRVHEFEMGPGSSGVVCTAMITDADGFGADCGMPSMHEVHGNLPDPAGFDVVWRSPRSGKVLDREGPMTYGEAVKLANRSRAAGSIALADVEPHVPAEAPERPCTCRASTEGGGHSHGCRYWRASTVAEVRTGDISAEVSEVRRLVKLWMRDGTTRYGEIGDVLDRIERLAPPAHTPAEPSHPAGTPEYEAYRAELRTELAKFAAGEEPYPYVAHTPAEAMCCAAESGLGVTTHEPDCPRFTPAAIAYRKAQQAEREQRLAAPAHTPAEARTGTPDTMAAIGAEVAVARRDLRVGDLPGAMAALDRIAAWAPERATDRYGVPLWLAPNGDMIAQHGYGLDGWRALYVQAGR